MYQGSLFGPTNFWHIPFLVIVAFFEISAHSDNFQGFNKEIHSFGHTFYSNLSIFSPKVLENRPTNFLRSSHYGSK
jgi:hypothetical protein